MRRLTLVSGLRLAGALSPLGRTASGPADLVLEAGRIGEAGAAAVLDTLEPSPQGVTLHQAGGAVFVRFGGLADAALDVNAGTATIELSGSAPPGMDQVLAGGPVLALALSLLGRSILHASAVSGRGRAVAFAAASGGGKTTLAALACLDGAEQVADDTLVVEENGTELRCLPGDRELRLRPAPAEMLEDAAWARRTTADGRIAVLAGSEELATPPWLPSSRPPSPPMAPRVSNSSEEPPPAKSFSAAPGSSFFRLLTRGDRCWIWSPPSPVASPSTA